jgi:ribosome-associated protein
MRSHEMTADRPRSFPLTIESFCNRVERFIREVNDMSSGLIPITPNIAIDESEIKYQFIRASGPGGQKVNKVSTAVQIRFDVGNSPSLPDDIRDRLIRLAGRRITAEGVLVIDARRFRTQEQNRKDAIERLVELIRKAAERPKSRRKTRPTLASKRRRLETKRRHGVTKRMRQSIVRSEE